MNLSNDTERVIEKLHITTKAETDKRILEEAFNVFEKSAFRKSPKAGHNVKPRFLYNRFIKVAAVAAAVIVVFAIFLNRYITKTVNPEKIYTKLAKTDNLCISTYHAGDMEPYQQVWTTQNITLFRISEENRVQFTLWDLSKKTKMTAFLSSNTIQTETISEKMIAELDESIIQSFGLFADIKDIPKNAQWIHIDDPGVVAIVPDSRVFELTWSQEITNGVAYRKWRFFINTKTDLPLRAESYVKFTTEGQYELENFSVYTYPQKDEIEALAEKAFDPAYLQPKRPRPISTPGMQ